MNGQNRNRTRFAALLLALVMVLCILPTNAALAEEEPSAAIQSTGEGFYLVGSMNGWKPTEGFQMFLNEGADVTEYMITLDFEAGAEFKVVYSSDGQINTNWYPGGENNNYKIEATGRYKVYFRPDGNGFDDWHEHTLNAIKQEQHAVTVNTYGNGTAVIDHASAYAGETVTVTLTANDGYQLRMLKVDGKEVTKEVVTLNGKAVVVSNTYTFTMPEHNVPVEAIFEAHTSPFVYLFVDGLGTAFADRYTAAAGETVTVTTEDTVGSVFDKLTVNGTEQTETTFTMPGTDVIVVAAFKVEKFTVKLVSEAQGSLHAIPTDGYAYAGTTVQITVNVNDSYVIDSLTVTPSDSSMTVSLSDPTTDGQTSVYTFTMPKCDVEVKATYRKVATNGYYLIGPDWSVSAIDGNDKFVEDQSVSGQMILTKTLTAGKEFKVVKVVNGEIDTWYPATGPNYEVQSNEAGNAIIYFRPNYGGGSGWYQDCIKVQKIENTYYLANATAGTIRSDDKLYINKEFDATENNIGTKYGVDHEHMVLTWLGASDTIKVVRVEGDTIKEWLPDGMANEYPTFRYSDGEHPQKQAYTGMTFVFFEEQIGKVGKDYPRVDWTNLVFDVQKAYKADAADKATVNPLNTESLTYNLEHGSITLSTGTPFVREGRSDESSIPEHTSNIIYELGLNQTVTCTILPEAGYALAGTPYYQLEDGTKVNLNGSGTTYTFQMPSNNIVIHAPMYKVFRSHSVLLSGQIGVNFFVDLGDYESQKDNCKMEFKVGNADAVTATINYDLKSTHSTATKTYYGYTCKVNAIQMADTITATLKCGDTTVSTHTYSLKEYVTNFDRTDSSVADDNNALRVIRAMLDFGYYAQQYIFTVNPSIQDHYVAVDRHYANSFDFEAIKAKTATHVAKKNIENSQVDHIGLQLAVDSATALLINFYMKDDTVPTLRLGSVTLDAEHPSGLYGDYAVSLSKDNDRGCYTLRIEGISPHNLDYRFTVNGTAGGSFSVTASAFSYLNSLLNATEGDAATLQKGKNLAAAMYQFHAAEVAYRQSSGQN